VRVIEVFADVWCPFTHVGLRRIVERRAELGREDDVVLRVRSWPLELVNGEPLTSAFVAEEIAALQEAVAPDLFVGFDRAAFPDTTLPALAVAASAYEHHDRIGERFSLALRTALFEEGRNVADPSELEAIAATVGIDLPGPEWLRTVDDDWHEGERRGVRGSPHFFLDGQGYFCPSLNIQRIDGHLRVRVDAPASEAFLGRCLREELPSS
jgi:predicted DsbA family dithiol-disulfide isomerase